MDSSDILADDRKINAIAAYFWSVCTADDREQQLWIARGNDRTGFLADAVVREFTWLAQFLRAWLIKSHGMEACRDSYEVCMAVFDRAKEVHNGGSGGFRRWSIQLTDCASAENDSTEPVLEREEFESILRATAAERIRMFETLTTLRKE
ncbi:hypothetical protein [Nocardia sp. CC227C]|uniref:hypothetical protein n=1 Tax=Nocardia sp. CC227C TaxID=3044562 RepID=UPI00278BEC2B|nr:hypothetical protein [Nocardia sp. CC227C]